METGTGSDAEPRDIPRVWRNLRLNQDDMQHSDKIITTTAQGEHRREPGTRDPTREA